MAAYGADIDPNDPDWIRWTSLREDLRQDAHERDVEHTVFVLLRVLQERYPEPVLEAGLTPEAVFDQLDLGEADKKRVVQRLQRDAVEPDPVRALPASVREAFDPPASQETSG